MKRDPLKKIERLFWSFDFGMEKHKYQREREELPQDVDFIKRTSQSTNFELTPKQALGVHAVLQYEMVGMGGARGPGKSVWLCFVGFLLSMMFPGNRGVIVRKDLVDLKDSTMERMRNVIIPAFESTVIFEWQDKSGRPNLRIRDRSWPEGVYSEIWWRDTKDEASLMSANLGWMGADEATEISEKFFLMTLAALGRCEIYDGSKPERRFFWAANPGPGWIKDNFPVGKNAARIEKVLELPDGSRKIVTWAFIPALAKDNKNLPFDYEANLRSMYPSEWVRRFIDGDWSAFEGQIFTEFNRDIFVAKQTFSMAGTPFVHILSGDWGHRNPAAFLIVTFGPVDSSGLPAVYVWREYRAAGRTPAQHLPYVKRLERGLDIAYYLMDPAAVDQSSGITIREQFKNLKDKDGFPVGIPFQGFRKRKHGPDGTILYLKQLFHRRRIWISPECAWLIQEIESARWQEHSASAAENSDPKELMVDKDDHSIDALFGALERYRIAPEDFGLRSPKSVHERMLDEESKLVRRLETEENRLVLYDEYGRPMGLGRNRGLGI